MKKFLSLILTLAMVLSLVTVPAMADAAADEITFQTELATSVVKGETLSITAVAPSNPTITGYEGYTAKQNGETWSWSANGSSAVQLTNADKAAVTVKGLAKATGVKLTVTFNKIYEKNGALDYTYTKTKDVILSVTDKFLASDIQSITIGGRTYTDMTNVYKYTADGLTNGAFTGVTLKSGYTFNSATLSGDILTVNATPEGGSANDATVNLNTGDLALNALTTNLAENKVISGGKITLTAPVTGSLATDAKVKWEYKVTAADDSTYATLTSTGAVSSSQSTYEWTAPSVSVSTSYTLRCTVYAGTTEIGGSKTVAVTVIPASDYTLQAPSSVTMTSALDVDLKSYTTPVKLYLTADTTKAAVSGVTYTFSSNKTDVVTVDTSGVLTALKTGSATITVTATYMGKTYTQSFTVTAKALDYTMAEVENGDYDTYSFSDLCSAVRSAVNELYGSGTVSSSNTMTLKIKTLPGTTAGTLKEGTSSTSTAYAAGGDVTSSDDVYFNAKEGFLGTSSFVVTATVGGTSYDVTFYVPVVSDGTFTEEIEATETTGGWEFYVPSGYDYLFYTKTLPTSDYDGYFTSSNTPSGWTKVSTSKTLTSSEFNSSGECKLYVVLLDDGVASTGTLTVTQTFGGIEYSGEVGDEIYFDEDDFVDYIEDFSSVYSATLTDVKFTNVKSVSSNVTLYNNGSKITDNTTKCTNLDKVYATATKAGTYDFNFTATANTKSSSSATEKKDQTFTGVVRVTVYDDGDIQYEVDANKSVTFNEDDFDKFYTKDTLSYIVFGTPSAGTLYENTRCTIKADTTTKYYFEATGSQDDLDTVTFEADKTPLTEYSVYIPFKAYAKNGTKMMEGTVEIIVNGSMPFTDVLESNTFYSYIKYCYRENIMQGKSTTLFKPTEPVTRAQLVVTLYRMANSPTTYNSNTMSFTDCKTLSTEFQNAIKWGVAKKLINGYGNTFKPNDSITRQAMVTILYRFGTNLGYIDGYGVTGNLNSFSDAAKISASMKDAVAWAVGAGLVSGNNGKFNPAGTTTRGACAKILAGFHETYVG